MSPKTRQQLTHWHSEFITEKLDKSCNDNVELSMVETPYSLYGIKIKLLPKYKSEHIEEYDCRYNYENLWFNDLEEKVKKHLIKQELRNAATNGHLERISKNLKAEYPFATEFIEENSNLQQNYNNLSRQYLLNKRIAQRTELKKERIEAQKQKLRQEKFKEQHPILYKLCIFPKKIFK